MAEKKEKTFKDLLADEKKRMEEEVEITLFSDNERYKDDLNVALNGQLNIVQRGVPVKMKRKIANVIGTSLSEDNKTSARIMSLTKAIKKEDKD